MGDWGLMELHIKLAVAGLADDLAMKAGELALNNFYFFAYLEVALVDGHDVLLGAGGNDEVFHLLEGHHKGRVLAKSVRSEVVVVVGDDGGKLLDVLLGLLLLVTRAVGRSDVALNELLGLALREVGEDHVGDELLDGGLHAALGLEIDGVAGDVGGGFEAREELGGLVFATIAGAEDVPLVTILFRQDVLYRHPILCIVAPFEDSTGGKPGI